MDFDEDVGDAAELPVRALRSFRHVHLQVQVKVGELVGDDVFQARLHDLLRFADYPCLLLFIHPLLTLIHPQFVDFERDPELHLNALLCGKLLLDTVYQHGFQSVRQVVEIHILARLAMLEGLVESCGSPMLQVRHIRVSSLCVQLDVDGREGSVVVDVLGAMDDGAVVSLVL